MTDHRAPEPTSEPGNPLGSTATDDNKSSGRRGPVKLGLGLVSVVGVVVLAAAFLAPSENSSTSPLVVTGSDLAKPFVLENVVKGGPKVSLASYRHRPVVVNFWASWCVPCRREMPDFQAVHAQVNDRVAFVGVNHQDSREAALDLLRETGTRYPSGYDPEGSVAATYGLFGMPSTLFISPEGRLLERRTGEMSRRELTQTIERLFPATSRVENGRETLLLALCTARDQAVADPAAARATFFDRVHEDLHAIARDVEVLDRAAAAELLVAKQKVEAGFTASPAQLTAGLGQLALATQAALARLGTATAPCPP